MLSNHPNVLSGNGGGSNGATIGPALTNINSITSATGQTLTLATLDSNKAVIIAPHGTGPGFFNNTISAPSSVGTDWSGNFVVGTNSLTGAGLGFAYSTSGASVISSIQPGVAWKPLLIQVPNGSTTATLANGGLVVGHGGNGGSISLNLNEIVPWIANSMALGAVALPFSNLYLGAIPYFQGGSKRLAAQFDKTSSAALSDITGSGALTVALAAATSYRFRVVLYTTSNVAAGVQAAVAHSGTVTAIRYEGFAYSAGSITQTRASASGTAVGAVTAVTAATIIIEGTITTNAAGNLTAQFAQNVSNAAASSVLIGSYLEVFGF